MVTSPVSGSISTSQTAAPFGNTGVCISLSATTRSLPSLVMRFARQLEQVHRVVGAAQEEAAVVEIDLVGRGVELAAKRRRPSAIRSALALAITVAGVAHRAAGMRAAADADDVGVAEHDGHLVDRHLDEVGHHLGEAGLVALAARLGADDDIDARLPASRRSRRAPSACRSTNST